MQLIGITRETKLGQYCAKADWASAHGLQYQIKPNQEGVLVLNKQIVLEIIYLCFKRKHISSDISTRTWKPLTLPYEKSNTGGTKADSISAHRRRHDTNLNSEQVPYEA